jgi:hypothetical protein
MKPNNRRIRPRRNLILSRRPVDPIITAQRFPVPAAHVPQHNVAPSVTRTVRIVTNLSSALTTLIVLPNDIAITDAQNYTGTSNLRYHTMRFLAARFWAESPANLSVSQQAYGLVITEPTTDFTMTDRPTTGSRMSAIGLRFPFQVRSTFYLCTDTTTYVVLITTDTAIAASTEYTITCDYTVEFSG